MPANSLLGLTTKTGWTVTHKINTPLGSGGNFCVRYKANSPTEGDAFLKAMDLTGCRDLAEINSVSGEYLFEQRILKLCAEKNLRRVVRSLDAGTITIPNRSAPYDKAYYVIFEEAKSDVRQEHLNGTATEYESKFKVLHHVAVGISQLHRNEISHQDVKPSNVLVYDDDEHKVADLGRVVDKSGTSPFANNPFPGDMGYMPIELHYGVRNLEFSTRVLCDIYMVGSLLYQLLQGIQIKTSVIREAQAIQGGVLTMSFQDALPILISAHNIVLERLRTECTSKLDNVISGLIVEIVDQMCHPDPRIRGVTKRSQSSQHISMDRFVGKLSSLCRNSMIRSGS